jgi:hypothetical protein
MFAAKNVRRRINRREKIRNEASREERITTLLIDSAFVYAYRQLAPMWIGYNRALAKS